MKKLIIFTLMFLFLFSYVSAVRVDYSPNDKGVKDMKAVVKDTILFGLISVGEQGTMELKSHKSPTEIIEVGTGWQVTMIYDTNFGQAHKDILGNVYFYDLKTGEEVEREYKFVYWGTEERSREVCIEYQNVTNSTTKNSIPYIECSKYVNESYLYEGWLDYNSKDLPKGQIKLGLMTNVLYKDKIDGVWEVQGKKIEKHAGWTSELSTDLVSYYKLDETSGTTATDSHGSNNGVNDGGDFTTGKINGAYDFEAGNTDWVNLSTSSSFNIAPDISISMWVKIESNPSFTVMLGKDCGSTYTCNQYRMVLDSSRMAGFERASSSSIDNFMTSNLSLSNGVWYHMVGVGNSTHNLLYINGLLRGIVAYSGVLYTTTSPLYIARRGNGGYFDGVIDEVGIWSRALSSEEVSELYNSGTGINYELLKLEINLTSPIDYYNSSSQTIDFSANLTDEWDLGITNVSLVINDTIYDTNTSGLTGVYNFSETLSDGFYEWYIEAYDNDSVNYTSETRYFTIDSTEPYINANLKQEIIYNYGDNITLNYNITDDNLDNCWYNYNDTNSSLNCSESVYNITAVEGYTDIIVYANDTFGNENSTELSFEYSTIPPTVNITSPLTSYDYLEDNETIDLNFTSETNGTIDTCWYDYNGTNIYFNCSENTTFNYEEDNDNITVYFNDTLGNEVNETIEWVRIIDSLNLTYEEEVYEGVQNTFNVDMLLDGSLQQAYLQYNQTNYTTSVSYSGGMYSISSTINSPLVDNDTNVTFSFWFKVDDVWYNLLSNNQSVLALYFGSCSPSDTIMLNISLLDERLQTPINGTIEFNGYLTNKLTSQVVQSTNLSFNNVNLAQICLNPLDAYDNYYLYSEMRYYKTDTHVPELYNIDKADLGNYPKNMSLYDLGINESTEFLITYKDDNFIKVEGAIIQLQRKYIAEDSYKVVEAPKTSSSGTAVVHVDLDSILYKSVVVKDGVVLDTFDNIVFHCENLFSGVCNQELKGEVDPENIIEVEDLEDFSYTITEENNTITLQYSIPSGTSSDINIIMTQKDSYGNVTLCNQSIISSGGSLECDYTDSITQSYITFEVLKDDELIDYRTYVIRGSEEINFLNNNYFIVVMLLLSLVGMAFTSPEWTIILSILTFLLAGGLFLLNGLNFVAGIGGLIWLVISAVIIITKLSQQEDR